MATGAVAAGTAVPDPDAGLGTGTGEDASICCKRRLGCSTFRGLNLRKINKRGGHHNYTLIRLQLHNFSCKNIKPSRQIQLGSSLRDHLSVCAQHIHHSKQQLDDSKDYLTHQLKETTHWLSVVLKYWQCQTGPQKKSNVHHSCIKYITTHYAYNITAAFTFRNKLMVVQKSTVVPTDKKYILSFILCPVNKPGQSSGQRREHQYTQ